MFAILAHSACCRLAGYLTALLTILLQGKLRHFIFVASAGAYKADPIEPCHFEGDARKSSAGHVEVENYLKVGGKGRTRVSTWHGCWSQSTWHERDGGGCCFVRAERTKTGLPTLTKALYGAL